jgi:hypothetical protein
MSAKTKWTLAIVGLLLANAIAMVVLAVTSSSASPQLAPGYGERR